MERTDFTNINTTTKLSNFQVLNPDFTRCKCNVFYTGKNRNRSLITDEALQKLIERKGYANVPIVGHIKLNKQGKKIMGSHDRKIEISNDGIEEINECIAMGVVPLDANPRMEKIIGVNGIEKEYFTVDVILWTHYFPELMETAYSDEVYFNHSMEINCLDTDYSDDGYTIINDFSLQALCMLGKYDNNCENADISDNSEPCFEDSRIRRFSINENEFKRNFELMLEKLKQYETNDDSFVSNNKNIKKEENRRMDNSKIVEKLSEYTYENILGETVAKYSLVDSTETSIGVLDREDNKVYSFDCAEVESEIVIDMDSKAECSMTYKAVSENDCFNYANEVAREVETAQKKTETDLSKSFADEYNAKIDEITATYTQLKAEYDAMSVEFEKYKAADNARLEKEKHEQIDAVVEKYAKKIGRLPKFLCYRAKIDYTKEVADIENELILMAGEAMMDTSKQNFSYTPTNCSVSGTKNSSDKFSHEARYGNLFDKFIND